MRCYELVLDSLSVFENKPTTEADPAVPEPDNVRNYAYDLAFNSTDEMFHSTLYDWLIERQLADDLLEVSSAPLRRPSFVSFFNYLITKLPDPTGVPRIAPQARAYHGPKIPAAMAILRQRRPAPPRRGSARHTGRIKRVALHFVSRYHSLCCCADEMSCHGRFDLHLDSRLEYLTLAVGNAKSHPISAGGRHETAIAFLTDLEEKLDVAQVQLEIYNHLLPHVNDSPEVGERIKQLSKRLLTMSEVRICDCVYLIYTYIHMTVHITVC